MSVVSIGKPTKQQLVHGVERVLGVFCVAFMGSLKLSPNPASKDALTAAALAGGTAAYQLVLSLATNL